MSDVVNTFVVPIIRTDFIERCLETMHRHTPPGFQVVIIDQTPEGVLKDIPSRMFDGYFRPYRNLGFAKASNTGFKIAQGKVNEVFEHREYQEGLHKGFRWMELRNGDRLVLHGLLSTDFKFDPSFITTCNDDVEFINKRWWEGIIETFNKVETAVCVNPSCPKLPAWSMGTEEDVDLFPYEEDYTEEDYDSMLVHPEWGGEKVIDGICMWCTVFRTEAFEWVGYFDERFYPGAGEDYDYLGRSYKEGFRCVGTSRSWVYHHWGVSKDRMHEAKRAVVDPRLAWNKIYEIWPNGFDIWGKCPDRLPEVATMPLEIDYADIPKLWAGEAVS